MATELQPVTDAPLGFDGLAEGGSGSASPADYTVQFTPAGDADTPRTEKSEEIGLLETGKGVKTIEIQTDEQKVMITSCFYLTHFWGVACLELKLVGVHYRSRCMVVNWFYMKSCI